MRRPGVYLVIGVSFVITYVVVVGFAWAGRGWREVGPLALTAPPTRFEPPLAPQDVVERDLCELDGPADERLVRGTVHRGGPLYGCYNLYDDGSVVDAWVVDAAGVVLTDPDLLKEVGAWRWIGLVKTVGDLIVGGLALAAGFGFWFVYYRRSRPGPSRAYLVALAALPILGWIVLARLRKVTLPAKVRAFFQAAVGWSAFLLLVVPAGTPMDALSVAVVGLVDGGFVAAGVAAFLLVRPPDFGKPEGAEPVRSVAVTEPEASTFEIERPGSLPSFRDVGGMDDLKAELRETIGLSLAFAGEAEKYRLTWNGILLHGPPGVGKTFLARATAGEFGLNFVYVSAGDLVSAYRGESSRNVEEVFTKAARSVPCLLFFDEFDSIAQNRQDWPDQEARRTVNQLLQTIVEYRVVREQIVMAATNHIEQLDPAVIRPGRFDRHIRVDLPDEAARKAIFEASLRGRPTKGNLRLEELARRTTGLTPASIVHVVERAAMTALRRATGTGELDPITHADLVEALESRGGEDRPTIENWSWDDLVLPPDVISELQELQHVMEDPETARALGVEPPTGVLLTGPPGTGKTSIARVLAAEADCSFYPVTAADLTSMWMGESEKSIQRLFERARERRPSIIFIDEIDAVASKRGEWGSFDRQINELLLQMDGIAGQQGVFVLAATNRPDQLDPALLRGGRLSRTIHIPLPDQRGRERLLDLFTRKMPLHRVDLSDIAAETTGASGADLRALCQQAALHALVRVRAKSGDKRVTQQDFEEALADHAESRRANRGQE